MVVTHNAVALAFFGLIAAALPPAYAQEFPVKPVRMIVPFPPGAGPDIVSRTIGQKLAERWKQQLVVDNRPGAGGNIAVELAAKSAPDGYTLILVSNHFTSNPSLFRKVPYDPVRDFAPVTMAAFTPNILLVHPSLPVKSVKDLVRLAKSRPGELNVSSGGNGSVGHLAAEMFKTAAGVGMVHVPYKGPVAAVTALISGESSLGFLIAGAALPHVKAGKLRAVAVTGKNRSPAAPELPTVAEAGVPGYEIVAWQGVFAPAGTPPAIINKLGDDIIAVLRMNEIQQALSRQGLETIAGTATELGAYVKEDQVKWARIIKQANVRID